MIRNFSILMTLLSLTGCATQPTKQAEHTFSQQEKKEPSKEDHSWHQMVQGQMR